MRRTAYEFHLGLSTVVRVAALISTAALPSVMEAQTGDTITTRELTRGVTYVQFTDRTGPFVMYLVRVDLRRPHLEIRPARAHDQLKGRERTSEMAHRSSAGGDTVLAAVNADFFWLTTGENENNQVIAGEWWKGVRVTDSPYDTYDNAHVQLGMDASRRPFMDRYMFDGKAFAHGMTTPIITLNFNPTGNPEGTAFYTPRFGSITPRDTARVTSEAPLATAGHRGDTLLFVRRGPVANASGSSIPTDGAVLAAYGDGARMKEVQAMADGDTVRVLLSTLPRPPRGAAPAFLIGGWPQVLRDGKDVSGAAASVEGTISRNAEMRHPRTAAGFSRDGNTLYLLVVDGRSENSGGMTLAELARTMRKLGAWNAMNFDGGGSTTMVIDGAVKNVPSDATGERPVGNALLVVKKR